MREMKNSIRIFMILTASVVLASCAPRARGIIREYDYLANQTAMTQYDLARKYLNVKDYDKAVIEFRRFLDLYGDHYYADDAQLEIAKICESIGQYNEAANSYLLLRRKYPESDYASFSAFKAAENYEKLYRYETAVKCYFEGLEAYPYSEWAKRSADAILSLADKVQNKKAAKKYRDRVGKIRGK